MPASKTSNKPELVIAHWPAGATPHKRLGCDADYGPATGSDAFWVSLRLVRNGDESYFVSNAADDIRQIGLWVWLMPLADGGVRINVELKLHDVYSADIVQAERMVKTLRGLVKKAAPVPSTVAGTTQFAVAMTLLIDSLGIKRAVQYGGSARGADNLVPVAVALNDIAAEFERRLARVRVLAVNPA